MGAMEDVLPTAAVFALDNATIHVKADVVVAVDVADAVDVQDVLVLVAEAAEAAQEAAQEAVQEVAQGDVQDVQDVLTRAQDNVLIRVTEMVFTVSVRQIHLQCSTLLQN
jgi:hypothetical protein